MTLKTSIHLTAAVAMLVLATAGCDRDTGGLEPTPPNTNPIVFLDDFSSGLDYQAFLGSKLDAVSIDFNDRFAGTASLRVAIPDGEWSGGAFTTGTVRDLSGYDALTFMAKSSIPSTLDVAGLGNDNTGTSKFTAEWKSIPLTTSWQKFVIPIPLPEKLSSEQGLFFFAEAPEGGGHEVWFDEVKFETVGNISNPRPAIATETVNTFVGAILNVQGTRVIFNVGGSDQTIDHLPGYLTFASSNDTVAAVIDGAVRLVGKGSATITAKLGEVDATGVVTVISKVAPTTAAPNPTHPAGDVISLFSNTYTDVPVDRWLTDWSQEAEVVDFRVAGNDVKAYTITDVGFAGIEWAPDSARTIDATAMTHFHVDLWVGEGTYFGVKLVDFGADGVFGGDQDNQDSEHEIFVLETTTPALVAGEWISLDIPLTDFTSLLSTEHLAQIVIRHDVSTAFIDNVFFHK
ncbi:MAG: hypothetical protein OEN01_02735 [Candidatus Krumholzibacteria bacterium]|nr:hypothetical protein [Candidatus Krumholzibacteria bacterium]